MSDDIFGDDEQRDVELKKKHKLELDLELDDLKKVLSTPAGRRLIWRYLEMTKVHDGSAVNSGSWTYFNEGVRKLGTVIYNEIWDNMPEVYLLMSNEAKETR